MGRGQGLESVSASADQLVKLVPAEALGVLFQQALTKLQSNADPIIRRSTKPEHGDYQANAAMALAKQLGANPRELAEEIIDNLPANNVIESVEVAGPGFINIQLKHSYLQQLAENLNEDDRLGSSEVSDPLDVVIDYSAPNVAKEMHVGHLRSTVIGDALARILEFQGQKVIRQNHLGDYGTQFGMLLEQLDREYGLHEDSDGHDLNDFDELKRLYQQAKQNYDTDPDFAECARQQVVSLQAGDPGTVGRWQQMVQLTTEHANNIYQRLDITLTEENIKGESYYNEQLAGVVQQLVDAAVANEDKGVIGIFPDEGTPLVIQKSDGGYLYGTTDLAALQHRVRDLGAERIIYVTDARQADHFKAVFNAAEQMDWLESSEQVVHVPFGMILDAEGKPYKTRSGDTVPLIDLLDQVSIEARANLAERFDLGEEQIDEISEKISVAAIKYADLSPSRQRDYKFDLQQMASFTGDTGPYLQYADVRAQSIARKAEAAGIVPADSGQFDFSSESEKQLILKVAEFPEIVKQSADSLEPHHLCRHLHETAEAFTSFYENCPVLTAGESEQRSRLLLTQLTHKALATGLGLLGISSLERM